MPIRKSFFCGLPTPFFFAGRPGQEAELVGDVLFVDALDNYEALPQKIWKMYEHILERLDFDYFLRLDDDCVPHLSNIYALLLSIYGDGRAEDRPDYIGGNFRPAGVGDRNWHAGKVEDPAYEPSYAGEFRNAYLGGSGGVLLSRRSIEYIVNHGREGFFDPEEIYEDKVHGDVLAKAGIEPIGVGGGLVSFDVDLTEIALLSHLKNGVVNTAPVFSPSWRGRIWNSKEIRRDRRRKSCPNLFIACHSKRFLFLSVSKCACSTLKRIVFELENGRPFGSGKIHDELGYGHDPPAVFDLERRDEWQPLSNEGYVRFAVWRDPVDRIVSTYVDSVLGEPRNEMLAQLQDCGFDDFLDFAERVVGELSSLEMDEHLRPQSLCYNIEDLDELVALGDLDDFLLAKFGIAPSERFNVSGGKARFEPTQKQVERIRQIYQQDLELQPTWKGSAEASPTIGSLSDE